jgi:hypothetical protein
MTARSMARCYWRTDTAPATEVDVRWPKPLDCSAYACPVHLTAYGLEPPVNNRPAAGDRQAAYAVLAAAHTVLPPAAVISALGWAVTR